MMDENLTDTWDRCIKLSQSIYSLTRDAVDPLAERQGLEQRGFLLTLINARRYQPETVSAEKLHQLFPYSHPRNQEEFLVSLAKKGWLEKVSPGKYGLTDRAQLVLDKIQESFQTSLRELEALPDSELLELAGLFRDLVEYSLAAGQPDEKPRLVQSRNMQPEASAGTLAQIDQYVDDLNAFRDDTHIAAWRPLDVSGMAWEAFTLIWRDIVHDAAGLAERLRFRGHDEAAYAAALERLAERGWLTGTEDGYTITAEGKAARQQAEGRTNELFFAPWEQLGAARIQRFQDLLHQLQQNLSLELAAQAA